MTETPSNRFRYAVFFLFFISGATGLIYEVVWTRQLTLVLGNTHYSVATVLTTFMAGLALGSFFGGKWIDRHGNPLLVYAMLEAAIGLYCLAIPWLIDLALPLFKMIYAGFQSSYLESSFLRFLVCASILIIPTTLMGATLPVLGKFVSRNPEGIGRDVGTLYGLNTFGAVVGAYVSAYWLMRLLGISMTVYLAASINIGIAIIIFYFLKKFPSSFVLITDSTRNLEKKASLQSEPELTRKEWGVLLAFGVSGVAALIYQVAWNRIFSLVLGSSVYAFSLILTTFILGLALGTIAFSRLCHRFKDLNEVFSYLQLAIGFSALLTLPYFGSIPYVNRWVYLNWGQDFQTIQWANFLTILVLIFLPTFLMGGQFPVVIKLVAKRLDSLGKRVGQVYACNTIGTIIGAFLAGFILIPAVGIQDTLWISTLINITTGIVLLTFASQLNRQSKFVTLTMVLLLCLMGSQLVPRWDRAIISSGSFMPYRLADLEQAIEKKNKILFYKEGIHTTVTTELSYSGNIFLRVNGKTDASLAGDMRTQLLSGYIPMLVHPDPKNALVVGQGSGVTLGAVLSFPVESADLVEISPAVIEGSRYFGPFNNHSLDDSRVTTILQDGRNHLTLTDKSYDVVISEPSNPWISGVGALFTKDFYQLLVKKLNPGGIACVWVHTNMSPDNFKSIVKAFTSVFGHVTMWESIVGEDYLLVGSMQPYQLPFEKTQALFNDPKRGRALRRLGLAEIKDLMGLFIMDQEGLKNFSAEAPMHTDDNSLLEFNAPEYIYKDERHIIVRQLTPFFGGKPDLLKFTTTDVDTSLKVKKEVAALERTETQVKEIKRKAQVEQHLGRALEAVNAQQMEKALQNYFEVLKLDPDHVLTFFNMGNVYRGMRKYEKAEISYRKALEINPYYVFASMGLAQVYLVTKQPGKAHKVLNRALQILPEDAEIRTWLGLSYIKSNRLEEGLEEIMQAVQSDPYYLPAYFYLGLYLSESDSSKARKYLDYFLNRVAGDSRFKNMEQKARELLNKL
ncbi:MAG: tetratricopeptide repeat protein [Candidatus Nitronauta litoralis]|uniref:Polyamine aminopropyltransferase n=1 Tax=Candidatus Nitronauta litoralis TaxID=2705533 RepID=A0A7T0G126_9BACT|nr:MAG: tetratricopeptide repeat protein [Candidatus Nitronauta litoralis]